jgi:putative ABC transport system ATP-binding protein
MAIELKEVVKTYPARQATDSSVVRALDRVSIKVETGEWLAIMGPSGSGKSSLVNLLGCLDRPDSGEIILDGQPLSALYGNDQELDCLRAEKIGFIFQQFHLIPYLTALENVMLAQYFHSTTDDVEARAALAKVGLGDRLHHLPSQLSGGEQQRVCIARALINDPKIILADEPTGNLDAHNEEIVLRLLRECHAQGRTIIMVTHDPVVSRLADRKIELHHGRIAATEIFEMSDDQQFDEVLEEIWILMENGEPAEAERMAIDGALPMGLAIDKMETAGLVTRQTHSAEAPHTHKLVLDRCHEVIHPQDTHPPEHGTDILYFTPKGRKRAEDVIRRHRLAERLFIQTFKVSDEQEVEEQACKFEHILSPEVTDRICAFLGHPETCPHGSPIPRGECCPQTGTARLRERAVKAEA